jgi:transposase
MAYRTQHIDKKTGAVYVYSVESYWDKEKKASRNRQVCLGRLDENTGEIIPSGRKKRIARRAVEAAKSEDGVAASAKTFGPFALIDKVAHDVGLVDIAKKCFHQGTDDVLTLVYFVVHRGLPLSRIEGWSESVEHPGEGYIGSQRVSDLLRDLTDDIRERFFSLWMKKLSCTECFCYDITSVSSYSENNAYVRWGHNRDKEGLPQINLAMLFGQKSGLPAYFRYLPGSISDVSTLKTTIRSLDFLGQKKLTFVLDRGFYSEPNLDKLFHARYHFILAPPTGRKWVKALIDEHRDEISMPEHYRKDDEDGSLFMLTHLYNWKGRRCYLHIYFNTKRAAENYDGFTYDLLTWKDELESGRIDERHKEQYDRFFHVKETPKRGRKVTYDHEAIEKHRDRYAGFFCILTTEKMGPEDALEIYRNKDVVENCFDDLKNGLDMKRLRVHTAQAMASRLFVQFLALILLSKIRSVIKSSPKLKSMTVREVLEAMETVVRIRYSGRYGELMTELGPLQRDIVEAFGIGSYLKT